MSKRGSGSGDKAARDNRSNQLNPNNSAYYSSRQESDNDRDNDRDNSGSTKGK